MAHVVSFSHPSDDSNRLGSFLSLFREEESGHQNCLHPKTLEAKQRTVKGDHLECCMKVPWAPEVSRRLWWCTVPQFLACTEGDSFDLCSGNRFPKSFCVFEALMRTPLAAKSVYGKLRFTSFASAPRVSWCLGWVCCGSFPIMHYIVSSRESKGAYPMPRDRWIDGWMDRWIDGWMDGWMDGWIDG